ncbi:MAG: glutamate synthase subunit beta [Bacteroidales bacterium]|jgi:glutamate synthase (NADPH/NADH) small chain|nr:glutamate synthase subunit beta [Bacteroidales bacterium]
MGNPKAFLKIERKEAGYRPVHERVTDFGEVEQTLCEQDRKEQASRCMDCGVPFCHWSCPLGNRQSEWQDLVYKGEWRKAYENLQATDDFPEFTGRVCPALCEKGCVLNLASDPVTIRENEVAIVEKAFAEGFVKPRIAAKKSGKKVAVIGSGPAGLAAANQLSAMGHAVTVFERDEAPGGLLRLGIPDFKLTKKIIDRRLDVMKQQGVEFVCNANITTLPEGFDAAVIAIGAGVPRDLQAEGRELKGIHFALDFLKNQNRAVAARWIVDENDPLSAKGKHVLVIGGGDTGSDCVGTSVRQGAASVTQIEIMPKPPVGTNPATPWPYYPNVLKTSSSHKEGCERRWSLATSKFIGKDGQVTGVEVKCSESGKSEVIKADLVLLAMGFVHPEQEGLVANLNLATDARKNIAGNANLQTSAPKVFVAGDATTGASLVVRAIASGRNAAQAIHEYLSK